MSIERGIRAFMGSEIIAEHLRYSESDTYMVALVDLQGAYFRVSRALDGFIPGIKDVHWCIVDFLGTDYFQAVQSFYDSFDYMRMKEGFIYV